jgi:hypothetical protein
MADQSITATATIFASLIAAGISFLTLTLSKEQKISDFRQAWIDGLREDLAIWFSSARSMARATEERQLDEAQAAKAKFLLSEDQIRATRVMSAQAYYKIKLRLNSGEEQHIQLVTLIDQAINLQNATAKGESDGSKTIPAIEAAFEFSRSVLKTEWERVKDGEPRFRFAITWIPPILILLGLGYALLNHCLT